MPLCGPAISSSSADGWRQAHLPLAALGIRESLLEILLVVEPSGTRFVPLPLLVHLDELWIASERPPLAGDQPPSYGRADINPVRHQWLQGVRPAGAANEARSNNNPHFCEYMSSELGRHMKGGSSRSLCRVDGDHLEGRWLQTCDPRLIRRPDHFAYHRALPAVLGWYDYRLCYRQSATERLRTMQAISYSWRPKGCALAPVNGEAFDRWLGRRTLLFLGDSLSAQAYYSLVWLLGDSIASHADLHGVTPEEKKNFAAAGRAAFEHRMDSCESNVGNEGGFLSEATLRGGGKLIKILRHGQLFDELLKVDEAWWRPYLTQADIVVLNIGHHYHTIDRGFWRYDKLTRVAAKSFGRLMKPSAHLVFRTTNIGNLGCENASRPLRSRRDAWAQLTGNTTNLWSWQPGRSGTDFFRDKYSWRGPPLFERAWAAAAADAGFSERFAFLNVSFLDMRADGHVATSMRYSSMTGRYGGKAKVEFPLDCLHYCYPGPTDYWALTLTNLLMNNKRYA